MTNAALVGPCPHPVRARYWPTAFATAVLVLTLLTLLIPLTAAAADGLPFTPGSYETTSMPGNQRSTICIPDKTLNAKSLENMMNKAGDGSQRCRLKQRSLKDNVLTVSISCRYPNDLEGQGEMTVRVNGASFTSDTAFVLTADGESRDVSIKTKAQRVGDC